ncbi:MAG: filamentous hemagglutinin N-terminal domain-containing protein, partial [Burkholderiales bacterium]|nr:filamentous hemagglutinin N-terminal domain-containing protein [Burkholderiales bacterium]
MNCCYRLVWSALNRCWVAVAECARARGKTARVGAALAVAAGGALAAPPAAMQLPTGGQVTAGQAAVASQGSAMTINQGSNRAVIDWQRFDIGSQASVTVVQPARGSVLLNRVLGSDASQIYGRLSANGQVFLSNAAGIYFSPTASVDVGGLVATTHGMANVDFMAGSGRFSSTGGAGRVVNEGSLTAADGGYVVLAAPTVRNTGVVSARLGAAVLAAGDGVELQFDGAQGLADVRVSPAALAALVDNGGAVVAPGGRILLTAQAADRLQGGVVRMSGRLEADALTQDGGVIRLVASDAIAFSGRASADAAAQGRGGSIT